ncbi:MAG: hypothetical protein U0794_20680 [Isosphaeraceae bacterium]
MIRELVQTELQFVELPHPNCSQPSMNTTTSRTSSCKYRLEGRPIFRTLYQRR